MNTCWCFRLVFTGMIMIALGGLILAALFTNSVLCDQCRAKKTPSGHQTEAVTSYHSMTAINGAQQLTTSLPPNPPTQSSHRTAAVLDYGTVLSTLQWSRDYDTVLSTCQWSWQWGLCCSWHTRHCWHDIHMMADVTQASLLIWCVLSLTWHTSEHWHDILNTDSGQELGAWDITKSIRSSATWVWL